MGTLGPTMSWVPRWNSEKMIEADSWQMRMSVPCASWWVGILDRGTGSGLSKRKNDYRRVWSPLDKLTSQNLILFVCLFPIQQLLICFLYVGGMSPARGNTQSLNTQFIFQEGKPAGRLEVTKQNEEALPEMGT